MLKGDLDAIFNESAKAEVIKQTYLEYERIKTDMMHNPPVVKIQMGVDGVDWESFKSNLNQHCQNISRRLVTGRYFFKPFREVNVPKKGARKGEYRILSIACISDMLVQKLIYKCIYPDAELMFKQLSDVSFAYREGKSAPMAASHLYKCIQEGYNYVFDADIEKFFDTIPHSLLMDKLAAFLGGTNTLIYTYLKRFISVDRVVASSYINLKGRENIFKTKKPCRTKRIAGIPQGGVFSGLIANIYMHEFDQWVLENLGFRYDIKYVRYADDFLILYRNKEHEENIKQEVNTKIKELGLKINWDKTETGIDLLKRGESVEYVGFSVSKTGIRIKKANIKNFKKKIKKILIRTNIHTSGDCALKLLIARITFKYLGNETIGLRKCVKCGLYEVRRSWLSYFLSIHDVQQLRGIDTWVRKSIYGWYYKSTGQRLKRSKLQSLGLPRLEDIYRRIKKEEKLITAEKGKSNKSKNETKCHCKSVDAEKNRDYLLYQLLFDNY